jgi:hypothetical protein
MRSFFLAPLGLLFLLFLAGCGGGSKTQLAAGGQGRATLTVKWPERTRLIPDASNSIKVVIQKDSAVVAQQTVARPTAGGTVIADFLSLPTGNLTATATAFPNADGTGVAQSTATIPLVITADLVTLFSITMNSTIDHLDLTAATASVKANLTLKIVATAKDASGAVVLTTQNKLTWASSATSIATVDGVGNVTGVAVGSADITVTDTESGKAAKTTVTVTPLGPISFAVPIITNIATPNEIVPADFDGDGKMDIAVGTDNSVKIFYGKGDGTFETPVTLMTSTGRVTPFSAADMNGDGKPDLVCTAPNQVVVLDNAGGRNFASPIFIAAVSQLGALVTGDFNSDGKPDIGVVAYNHPGSTQTDIFTFFNQGGDVYTPGASVHNIWIITGLKTADLNADGKLDLLISITTSSVGGSGGNINFGDGAGNFSGGPTVGTASFNVNQTAIGDFNGDGKPDFVIANNNDGSVAVSLNQGGGAFGGPTYYGSGNYPDHLVATDFDGDGHPDIVIENRDATFFTVLRNTGGLFPTSKQFPTGLNSGPLSVADFNGDGKPDVVVSSSSGANLAVMLNNSP